MTAEASSRDVSALSEGLGQLPPPDAGAVVLPCDGILGTRAVWSCYSANAMHSHAAAAVAAERERLRGYFLDGERAVATVTECEACFTPDVCQIRGTCDHYAAEQLRISARAQEQTVASIPDAELLSRVVRSLARNRPRRKEFAWAAIHEAFGLGSTYSAQLLRRFGLDPDTGAELKTPND